MTQKKGLMVFMLALGVILLSTEPSPAAALSPELEKALNDSKYVYIQTERKDGQLGTPAEIWFMYHEGAVWVASPTTTYRAKRIQAGRTKAKVWAGKTDGPSFDATGSIVKDPQVNAVLFKTFAKKYPDGWSSYQARFESGLDDGSRVLIKYEPAK